MTWLDLNLDGFKVFVCFVFSAKDQAAEDACSDARSAQYETTGAGQVYKHR